MSKQSIICGRLDNEGKLELDLDEGLLYGFGLFATMAVKEGKVIHLRLHLKRMQDSWRELAFPGTFPLEKFQRMVELEGEQLKEGFFRLTVTAGNRLKGLAPAFLLTKGEIPYKEEDYERGLDLWLPSVRRNETSPLSYHKTLNYLDNLLVLRQGEQQGFQEGLFLNTQGFLAEGAKSNLFFVNQERIYTPAKSCGLLPGITRQEVIKIAGKLGYQIREGNFTLEHLREAEEVFLTNSLMGVMPVAKVDGIYRGKPGRITALLLENYRKIWYAKKDN